MDLASLLNFIDAIILLLSGNDCGTPAVDDIFCSTKTVICNIMVLFHLIDYILILGIHGVKCF